MKALDWLTDILVGWLVGSVVLGISFEVVGAIVGGDDAATALRWVGVVGGTVLGIVLMRRRRSQHESRGATPTPRVSNSLATATSVGKWAPDPTKRHELRFWTGSAWTDHVTDRGVPGIDPLPPTPAGRWAPDPTKRHELRFWTGSKWTEYVSDAGVGGIDPPVAVL